MRRLKDWPHLVRTSSLPTIYLLSAISSLFAVPLHHYSRDCWKSEQCSLARKTPRDSCQTAYVMLRTSRVNGAIRDSCQTARLRFLFLFPDFLVLFGRVMECSVFLGLASSHHEPHHLCHTLGSCRIYVDILLDVKLYAVYLGVYHCSCRCWQNHVSYPRYQKIQAVCLIMLYHIRIDMATVRERMEGETQGTTTFPAQKQCATFYLQNVISSLGCWCVVTCYGYSLSDSWATPSWWSSGSMFSIIHGQCFQLRL